MQEAVHVMGGFQITSVVLSLIFPLVCCSIPLFFFYLLNASAEKEVSVLKNREIAEIK